MDHGWMDGKILTSTPVESNNFIIEASDDLDNQESDAVNEHDISGGAEDIREQCVTIMDGKVLRTTTIDDEGERLKMENNKEKNVIEENETRVIVKRKRGRPRKGEERPRKEPTDDPKKFTVPSEENKTRWRNGKPSYWKWDIF